VEILQNINQLVAMASVTDSPAVRFVQGSWSLPKQPVVLPGVGNQGVGLVIKFENQEGGEIIN
jgi:hypothetical protein